MMKTSLFSAILIGATALSGVAAPAKPAPKAAAPNLICPITNEKIKSVKASAGSSTYKGKTYYFCCAGCKPMFDADPQKYIKEKAETEKPKVSEVPSGKA